MKLKVKVHILGSGFWSLNKILTGPDSDDADPDRKQQEQHTLTLFSSCESRPRPGPITTECILGSQSRLISETPLELSLT